MGDGDGWVTCAAGHRHWGRFGAAGVLVTDRHRCILQHRAPWTHDGDRWGVPGGARDSHEDPVAAALREAHEEAGIDPRSVQPLGLLRDDHGGWAYTSVVARAREPIAPHAANEESTEVRWWDQDAVEQLPLHRGLAGTWPRLRGAAEELVFVVDAANVVGARPDDWWRDRAGATGRLRDELIPLARAGITVDELPAGWTRLDALFPTVLMVTEGAARAAAPAEGSGRADTTVVGAAGTWSDRQVRLVAAPRDGDSEIRRQAATAQATGAHVIVISADRELRTGLAPGVESRGPSWLLERLPRR